MSTGVRKLTEKLRQEISEISKIHRKVPTVAYSMNKAPRKKSGNSIMSAPKINIINAHKDSSRCRQVEKILSCDEIKENDNEDAYMLELNKMNNGISTNTHENIKNKRLYSPEENQDDYEERVNSNFMSIKLGNTSAGKNNNISRDSYSEMYFY